MEQSPERVPEIPVFDEPSLLERVFGDADMVRAVIEVFVEDCPVRLDAIADAAGRRDPEGLRMAAHALKGAAGSVSAMRLFEAARALEDIGAASRLEGVDAACERLSSEAAGALAVLRHRMCPCV